jgi:hypothetical protein
VGEVEAGRRDEPALGADVLEEHHPLQREEDDRVNGGATPFGVQRSRPVADKTQIERQLEMPVEVVGGDKGLK